MWSASPSPARSRAAAASRRQAQLGARAEGTWSPVPGGIHTASVLELNHGRADFLNVSECSPVDPPSTEVSLLKLERESMSLLDLS